MVGRNAGGRFGWGRHWRLGRCRWHWWLGRRGTVRSRGGTVPSRGGYVWGSPGDRARCRRLVFTDPFVPPRLVVLLVVALGLVDGRELARDLLPVGPIPAGHLVGAHVDLPPGPGALHPAVRPRMLEREALGGQVIGVADVDDRVVAGLGNGIGLVQDRVDGRAGRRSPAAEQPRPLERVPGERAEPDHSKPPTASCSPTASTRTIGEAGSPARATALVNSSVAFPTASSRLLA